MTSRPLRIAAHSHALTPTEPAWPSFGGGAQYVGVSKTGVSVWYDATLGAPALKNAQDLLADADRIRAANDAIFGTTGGPVDVIVFALGEATDGTGGADHLGCDYSSGAQIEVCASFGNSMRCGALFEAELSEDSMNGQLCGLSTGEALSRWCSMVIGANALADFASVPTWDQDGRADWVNKIDQTDQNYDSIGCGMAFISWMMKGQTLAKIAQTMVGLGDGGTLAALYGRLTGDAAANAWPAFQNALGQLGVDLTTDDPFGALGAPVPQPVPPPAPPPTPPPAPPPPAPSPVPPPSPPPSSVIAAVSINFLDASGKTVNGVVLQAVP